MSSNKIEQYYIVSNNDDAHEYVLATGVAEARRRVKNPVLRQGILKDLKIMKAPCFHYLHYYLPLDGYTPSQVMASHHVDQMIAGKPACRMCYEHESKPLPQRVTELELAVARINDELERR